MALSWIVLGSPGIEFAKYMSSLSIALVHSMMINPEAISQGLKSLANFVDPLLIYLTCRIDVKYRSDDATIGTDRVN